MTHSCGSVTRAKMNAPIIVLFCSIIGSAVCYNVQRELPYNIGPNDPYAVEVARNFGLEPSQQLFWGNGGSNQVGGNGGLWSKITSKFPFLENMFGRMQLPTQYGVPNFQQQSGVPISPQQNFATQQFQPQKYFAPQQFQPQQYFAQQQLQPQQYFAQQQLQPQQYFAQQQLQPQQYLTPQQFQPQFYRAQYQQQLLPSARDVGFTDDAVIVTPPQVPISPQPAPQPIPVPAPVPAPAPAPAPAPQPSPGYSYNKPQYRLELPHK